MRQLRKQFDIWIADLNPRIGTEPGKTRPVIIVQTDLLNAVHPSTVICPITSISKLEASILRLSITSTESGLNNDSDILVDQVRAIDNRRFMYKVGSIPTIKQQLLLANLARLFDMGFKRSLLAY